MQFPAFSAGHFPSKYVQLFILPISSVVGNSKKKEKVQCLRKKRPVTPSELWNNTEDKRLLTQEHHAIQCEKYTSHPLFLADSPLAPRACSHSTVSKEK